LIRYISHGIASWATSMTAIVAAATVAAASAANRSALPSPSPASLRE
jgi:hypothetical protein